MKQSQGTAEDLGQEMEVTIENNYCLVTSWPFSRNKMAKRPGLPEPPHSPTGAISTRKQERNLVPLY